MLLQWELSVAAALLGAVFLYPKKCASMAALVCLTDKIFDDNQSSKIKFFLSFTKVIVSMILKVIVKKNSKNSKKNLYQKGVKVYLPIYGLLWTTTLLWRRETVTGLGIARYCKYSAKRKIYDFPCLNETRF